MATKSAQRKSRVGAAPRKAARRPARAATAANVTPQPAPRQAEDPQFALRILQQIAQSLGSELNLERLLRKIIVAALDVMQASAGTLFLHDPQADELIFSVVEGSGKEALEGRRMSSRVGIAGWVFTQGESLIVDDVSQDNRFNAGFDKSSGFHTDSLICVPLIITGKKIGVLEVLNKRSGEHFNATDLNVLNTLAVQSAGAIENARLYQNLWEERNRILAVEEDVRKEMARDVHDGPAQLLSAIVMNIRFVQALLAEDSVDMARQELVGLDELATRTLKQLRELLFNQRPVILETQGLFPALETYVKRIQDAHEMEITLDITCEPITLPGKADRTVFSIVQEAVGNVKKHAPNARVQIHLEQDGDLLIVKVMDNGPGFDMERIESTYDQRGSLGLLNMSERAQQIGGDLKIDSALGKGTHVVLSVPINTEVRTLSPRT